MAFINRLGRGPLWIRLVLLVVLLVIIGYRRGFFEGFVGDPVLETPTLESQQVGDGAAEVERLYQTKRSGVMVEVSGEVNRLLPEDTEGPPHQRFIIQLSNGWTLLVSHNLDLAERVPVSVGDPVEVRGQYEWNAQGGLLHWTHHDPRGDRPGGWIVHKGTKYR